jgi:uncharacterized protein (DUF433 family)
MDGYTPAQAAALTGLALAAVHKAIDGKLIRPRARSGATARRLLTKEQLIFLQLEAEGLRLLPVTTRREIAERIRQSPKVDVLAVGKGTAILVDVTTARRKVESQLTRLARIEDSIVRDPEIMRGAPVFKGTQIPVDLVAGMLAKGATMEQILEGYPTLNKEQVDSAAFYMSAFPRRGRPTNQAWSGKKPRGRKPSALRALFKSA